MIIIQQLISLLQKPKNSSAQYTGMGVNQGTPTLIAFNGVKVLEISLLTMVIILFASMQLQVKRFSRI